jgi:hypothetical protein
MKNKLILVFSLIVILSLTFVSASRLPSVGSDNSTWGDVLNDYLSRLAGANATELNLTMVNGTNIYSSSINTLHILDKTITGNDLADNSVNSSAIDLTEVTLSTFTNDANYLSKDEGGTIDGSLIINGNLTLIGSYFNATVTNQYLNGSFLPEITNIFDLGSSLLKWANLYVTNLYASKIYSDDWSNVTIQESQITDLQSYLTSESDPLYSAWDKDYSDLINTPIIPTIWDATFNTTGDARWSGADTQKSADGIYLYNDSTTIYFNETRLNDTIENKIAGVGGDNSSWNESYADTKYLGIADQRYNETSLILSINTTSNIMGLGFYNETEVDDLISSAGNSSFNQTLTDTLYYSITNPLNFLNQTHADLIYAPINYGDEWNKTYADTLYLNRTSEGLYLSTYNATYDLWAYNQTSPAIDYADNINTTLSSRIDSIDAGNSSFNQTLTDTLYSGIEWDYNQTIPAMDYTNTQINTVNTTSNIDSLGFLNKSGTNANQDINISPYNLETGNLTLASKIIFSLGGIIDNIVDGWITITGNLQVSGNINVTGNITTTDTFCFTADCSAKMYHNGSGIIISS